MPGNTLWNVIYRCTEVGGDGVELNLAGVRSLGLLCRSVMQAHKRAAAGNPVF